VVAAGLHTDPTYSLGAFINPDDSLRRQGIDTLKRGVVLCGQVGASFIIWPGSEGYNSTFQRPYAQAWRAFVEGIAEVTDHANERSVKVFLEHKNSEPAMKILMQNIGRRVRAGPFGAYPRLLPRRAGCVPPDGRNLVCGRLLAVVARDAGQRLRRARAGSLADRARRGRPPVLALPLGRAYATPGPTGVRLLLRAHGSARRCAPDPRRYGGRPLLLEGLAGDPARARRTRAAGTRHRGRARSALWRELQSGVYGEPIHRTTADEGPAHGAALLAGVYGEVDEACSTVRLRDEITEPDPERTRIYKERYELYRSLYPATREAMHRLTDLAAGPADGAG
jgi:hypothetical protein